MPAPKRTRFIQHQRRKSQKKRKKLLFPTPAEREQIKDHQWRLQRYVGKPDDRHLRHVEQVHRISMKEVIGGLAKQFPNEPLRILNEGAGYSSLKMSLEQICFFAHLPKPIVTQTDLRQTRPDIVIAAPEQIVEKLGRNRFHLIMSTYGGTTYSSLPKIKAFANIISALRNGGFASIAVYADYEETTRALETIRKKFKNTPFRYNLKKPRPSDGPLLLEIRRSP